MIPAISAVSAGADKVQGGHMPRRRISEAMQSSQAQRAQRAQRVHDVDLNADTMDVDGQEVIDLVGSPAVAGGSFCLLAPTIRFVGCLSNARHTSLVFGCTKQLT